MSTEATLSHHLRAISEGVEAILSDYTEASVLFTPNGPAVGLTGVRSFFQSFLANSPPELLESMTLLRQDIHGEIAYIHWKAEPFIPLASDTFVIRNGKILAHSFAVLAPADVAAPGTTPNATIPQS